MWTRDETDPEGVVLRAALKQAWFFHFWILIGALGIHAEYIEWFLFIISRFEASQIIQSIIFKSRLRFFQSFRFPFEERSSTLAVVENVIFNCLLFVQTQVDLFLLGRIRTVVSASLVLLGSSFRSTLTGDGCQHGGEWIVLLFDH